MLQKSRMKFRCGLVLFPPAASKCIPLAQLSERLQSGSSQLSFAVSLASLSNCTTHVEVPSIRLTDLATGALKKKRGRK